MKCPYCGEEMQLGCIQCRDGVYWSEKERVIAALNIGGGKSIKLNEKSIGGPFGGASAEAWLCEKCKKIVIEAFLEAAKRYARGGYDVIVDGIVGPWFLEPWLNIVQEHYEVH